MLKCGTLIAFFNINGEVRNFLILKRIFIIIFVKFKLFVYYIIDSFSDLIKFPLHRFFKLFAYVVKIYF
jgi:hypothetical protein